MALLVGALLALAVGVFARLSGLDRDRAFYPTVAIVVASYYCLFAVIGGSTRALALETLAAGAFVAAAVIGFRSSLWIVAIALAAHGIFDLVHDAVISNPGVPGWWPAFCSTYDVAAAAFLAWLLASRRLAVAPGGRARALALGALCLLVPAPLGAQPRALPERLIDMHFHVWETVPPAGAPREALLAALDRYRVRTAVVSGSVPLVLELRRIAPERFIGGAAYTEAIPLPPVRALEAHVRAARLGVLGEIDAQYAGEPLDARWLDPYWALAEALDVPAAVHTGFGQPGTPYGTCCPKYRAHLGNPKALEGALARHPKLRVYLMHAGWPYLADTKAILHMYPHVYADLASFAHNPGIPREEFYDYLRALLRAGFGKRLMFGSGLSPDDWAREIPAAIALIEDAPFLTPEEKADIFHDNAARFLRLAPPAAK